MILRTAPPKSSLAAPDPLPDKLEEKVWSTAIDQLVRLIPLYVGELMSQLIKIRPSKILTIQDERYKINTFVLATSNIS